MVLVTIPKLYFKLVISPHKMGEESITMGTRKWAGPRLDLEGRNWGPKGPEKEGPKGPPPALRGRSRGVAIPRS